MSPGSASSSVAKSESVVLEDGQRKVSPEAGGVGAKESNVQARRVIPLRRNEKKLQHNFWKWDVSNDLLPSVSCGYTRRPFPSTGCRPAALP